MLTEEQIEFLNKVCPDRWTEENDVINVDGDVNISHMNLTEIPVQFGQVQGYFVCSSNKLTTLKGAPHKVEGIFNCDQNKLTWLEGGPKEVGGYYSCDRNQLTNLIGAPEICNGHFWCQLNLLKSLEGCPRVIKGDLYCINNPHLKYLWGLGHVNGMVCTNNETKIKKWIIVCMKRGIIFPHLTLEENINWIKREQKYSCLLGAPKEIRKYFSPRILNLVDSGVYNESRILDYKKFSRLC